MPAATGHVVSLFPGFEEWTPSIYHRAICSCGWASELRRSFTGTARADGIAHTRQEAAA